MSHRGQWSEHEARGVLVAWRKSGQSIERFAKERSLVSQRIRWWKAKLEGKSTALVRSESSLALLPVHVTEPAPRRTAPAGRLTRDTPIDVFMTGPRLLVAPLRRGASPAIPDRPPRPMPRCAHRRGAGGIAALGAAPGRGRRGT